MAPTQQDGSRPSSALASGAVEHLYRDHHRELVRLAVLLIGDRGRAEEVVQDAFVDVFQRGDRLREHGKLISYLKTSVAHAAASLHRHRRVVERHPPAPASAVSSAESTAFAEINRRQMMATLQRLPERQRQVLILRYYSELSESEIASALRISRGAVKSHSARGLRSLRPYLEAEA